MTMQLMQTETTLGSTISTIETADEARQRIRSQPHLAFHRIWCEYAGGRLFLRGQVPSLDHKQLAHDTVAEMESVDEVVNEIEVVW
jgi:osmotically-inducible protein OsmY